MPTCGWLSPWIELIDGCQSCEFQRGLREVAHQAQPVLSRRGSGAVMMPQVFPAIVGVLTAVSIAGLASTLRSRRQRTENP
jgi:hypothetical protein